MPPQRRHFIFIPLSRPVDPICLYDTITEAGKSIPDPVTELYMIRFSLVRSMIQLFQFKTDNYY
ncbi:MAG: hypothetical protein C4527_00795 [Candidatus Omnitrophota bacterium]|jgi:hypothetical protein|nr:MAG: hypothetical protein C4527_00795 [Candidatus Omnitrophota bacterium]